MATRYCNVDLASGANDGTSEANAYQDFSTAVAATVAGDVLYVKKASSRHDDGGITISNNGTKAAFITIEGYETTPGDNGRFEYGDYFEIDGDYILLKNIDVEMSRASTNGVVRVDSTSEKVIIHNCRIYNTNTGNYMTVRVNTACVITDSEIISDGNITTDQRGVIDLNSFDGLLVCGCIIRGKKGIDLRPYFHGVTIEGCLFFDAPNQAMERGIHLDMQSGTSQTGEVAILNNTIHASDCGIEVIENLDAGEGVTFVIRGNVIYGDGSSDGIRNEDTDSTVGPSICFNATGNMSTDDHGITGWGHAGSTGQASSGIYGNIQLSADPFVDKDNRDYRLNGTAGGGAECRAAMGFSVGLTASNRRDIGAYGHSGLIERVSVG